MDYLSPTSIDLFNSDRMEFYLRYIAKNKTPRIPQTQPMSIGAAFDAYCKSYISDAVFGKGVKPQFDLKKIFESQVEPHNRTWAWENGARLFEAYKASGALASLMIEIGKAEGEIKMEFQVQGDIGGVPLLGKPDLYFLTKDGAKVVTDWKVNGYCSAGRLSPKPGYVMVRSGSDIVTRGDGSPHKDCQLMLKNGITINIGTSLDLIDPTWAAQLSIYAWVLGESVGSDFIVGIEQITNSPLRMASHRLLIRKEYQLELLERIQYIWRCIQEDWIFDELTLTESRARGAVLEDYHKAFQSDDPQQEELLALIRNEQNQNYYK